MKAKFLLTVSFFSIWLTTLAQPGDSIANKTPWTLRECVDYALANNLQVKRSELTLELTSIDKRQSKLALLPTVNAFGSYGFNWGRGIDPVTNQFISSQRNGYTSLGASSDVTLFNGFRLQNTMKQASREFEATEQDLAKSRNDVTLNVISLFVNVVFNKELVENARLQLSSSQQQLERTRKLVAAGSVPKSNELNLDAQVATNELNLINQENALNLSMLQLQQALQIPANDNFDVETPELNPEDLVLDQSRDEIFDIARGTMPEIKSAKLRIESSYYGVKASRGNLYPRISVNGSINTNYSSASATRFVPDGGFNAFETGYFVQGTNAPVYGLQPTGSFQDIYGFNDQVKDNIYKSVSLRLTIPIFNNFNARANLQRAMISNEQAKISARESENTLRQTVETSYNNAIAASKSYNAALRQVDAREEAYRMAKQRFDIGAANYLEYQVAENDLFQARSDLARGKYEFIFWKKVLDFYLGNPLGF
ncbi:MAG TPA: TolC family protein [Chryseosolibacter sp.]|nr:TolC family protein [Chryseosolibacter sp.]